ncbi:MAG: pilus assembly PilX N-terminal domain-containing protein [bacterium]|nr:pilus assembly PilX N-terminal domain-containing protein [bacterium]
MKNKKIKNRKASALAYALIIMAIVMIILTSMLGYITSQIKFSANRAQREEAFQIAEAGIYFYRWYLAHETAGKTASEVDDFWKNGNPLGVGVDPYVKSFSDPEGGEIGEYSIEVEPPSAGSTVAIVRSTGWTNKLPGTERTVQVRFRRPSWSEYAILANDVMRIGENTEVFGKLHSNYGIRFDGLAHNVISSSVATYDDPDHSGGNEFGVHTHVDPSNGSVGNGFQEDEAPPSLVPDRSDIFEVGRQFPVPKVDFNGIMSDLNFLKSESQTSNGIYYDNEECSNKKNLGRHITITGNTMTVSVVTDYNNANYSIKREDCILTNVPIPQDGIVFVENNIWLEGTINGRKVTFVAADLSGGELANIYMGMDNLLYTNFDGTDIIGILAQGDLEIVKDSLDDLTIDAALLSQSGRVGRNNYTPFGCSSQSCEDHKGTITINGAMATFMRYGFAYTNGTGYSYRILNFDNNLLYYPPPYFPTRTYYFIDLWEEI